MLYSQLPTEPDRFFLPDLLALCPLQGATNPHYELAGAESSSWIDSYEVFPESKRWEFIAGCNELLVSHTYPYAGYDQFRTCCDFVNLLFVVDEVSDEQNGKDARTTGNIFLDVMCGEKVHKGSSLSQMTQDFRDRFLRQAGPLCHKRFLVHCAEYVDCVAKEAELRERGEVLAIAPFTDLRRENSAIRLCFGLFEAVLGIDLPNEVFEDEVFMRLYWAAADMVCWANDVYSYNMEQAKGHSGNNIVTVLMYAKGFTLQEASDYVGVHFAGLMDAFLADKARLHSFGGDVDKDVALYVRAMEHWVVGNLEWSFETQRYFGPYHDEVKRTRLVFIKPREVVHESYLSDEEGDC